RKRREPDERPARAWRPPREVTGWGWFMNAAPGAGGWATLPGRRGVRMVGASDPIGEARMKILWPSARFNSVTFLPVRGWLLARSMRSLFLFDPATGRECSVHLGGLM